MRTVNSAHSIEWRKGGGAGDAPIVGVVQVDTNDFSGVRLAPGARVPGQFGSLVVAKSPSDHQPTLRLARAIQTGYHGAVPIIVCRSLQCAGWDAGVLHIPAMQRMPPGATASAAQQDGLVSFLYLLGRSR